MTAGKLSPVPKLSLRLEADAQMKNSFFSLSSTFVDFVKLKETQSLHCCSQATLQHLCTPFVPIVSFCFHFILHSVSFFNRACIFSCLSFDLLRDLCVQYFVFSWFYWRIWPIPTLPCQWEIISSPLKAHVPVSTSALSSHYMCICLCALEAYLCDLSHCCWCKLWSWNFYMRWKVQENNLHFHVRARV